MTASRARRREPCMDDYCAMLPLHHHCLFKLGVYLGEMSYSSELAEWLRDNKRSRFLLTAHRCGCRGLSAPRPRRSPPYSVGGYPPLTDSSSRSRLRDGVRVGACERRAQPHRTWPAIRACDGDVRPSCRRDDRWPAGLRRGPRKGDRCRWRALSCIASTPSGATCGGSSVSGMPTGGSAMPIVRRTRAEVDRGEAADRIGRAATADRGRDRRAGSRGR